MSFTHSHSYEQSRALNGIGSSSSRGTKRTSDAHIYDQPGATCWKKDATPIQTASTRRPRNVSNPYDRMRDSEMPSRGNLTAARTAINQSYTKSSKRPRTIAEGFNGLPLAFPKKYSESEGRDEPSRSQRAIPSTIRAGPISSHTSTTSKYYRERENVASSSANAINVESEPEDLGVIVSRSNSLSVSEWREGIDLTDRPSEHALRPSLSRTSEWNSGLINGTSYERGEKLSSDGTRNSDRSSLDFWSSHRTVRRLPEDGPSTDRLNGKLRALDPRYITRLGDRVQSNNPSEAAVDSRGVAGPRLRSSPTKKVKVDLTESDEIEVFPETLKPSSSKPPAGESMPKRVSVGPQLSGSSATTNGWVRQQRAGSERNSQPPYFSDLRGVGSKINRMKGKDNKGNARVERPGTGSNVASRDKLATASTPYTRHIAFPLELLIWGNRKSQLDKNETQPYYWLYWNDSTQEVQVHKHPLDPKTLSRKKPEYSISLSILTDGKVQISEVSDFHLLRFEPRSSRLQELPDDVRKEGLTFKFMSNHSNMTDWATFESRLKGLLDKKGSKAEILKGSNASGCLESALRSVAMVERTHEDKRQKSAELVDDPIETADSKEEIVAVKKRKQPRPRPVTGRRDQNIAEMLQPRRRSSRLSEAPKPDKGEGEEEEKEQHREPPVNADEIILVYPRSGQGAVNITVGDLRRLDPYEFLNDTLIEFGLKLWLNDLRETQPELADSVHVFSSFFFKKLASKSNKTSEEGHKSVRKWTAKVDLFKKKFIVVPINENIHWYLAIIYRPEHILEPAPPKPPPRTSKRVSNAAATGRQTRSRKEDEIEVVKVANNGNDGGIPVGTPGTTTESNSVAEAEVEGLIDGIEPVQKDKTHPDGSEITAQLNPDGNHSANIEDFMKESTEGFSRPESAVDEMDVDVQPSGEPSKAGSTAEEMSVVNDSCSEGSDEQVDQLADDEDGNELIEWSTADSPVRMQSHASAPPKTPGLDSDRGYSREADDRSESFQYPDDETSGDLAERKEQGLPSDGMDIDEEHRATPTVSTASFYGKPSRSVRTYVDRKRPSDDSGQDSGQAERNGEDDVDELDMLTSREQQQKEQNERSDDVEVTDYPRTIIFCMDSLNGNHPRALSRLNEYLQEEAKDKKGISNPSPAKTRKATMPIQPNHCDCGLYLLHFARNFVADPEKYVESIFSNKRSSDDSRKALWNIDQVANMREKLKERILEESAEWKKQKAEREQKEIGGREATGADSAIQPPRAGESDDEIEVSEVRLVASPPKKPTRTQAAARLR